jgi:hypothetical protein
MRTAAPPKEKSPSARRLTELRIKAACAVHKPVGDTEEIREDGLRVYRALAAVRTRANKSCK